MPDDASVMKTLLESYRPVINGDLMAYELLRKTTKPQDKAAVYTLIISEIQDIKRQLESNLSSLGRGELDRKAAEALMEKAAALAEESRESGKRQLVSTYGQLATGIGKMLGDKKA